MCLKTKSRSNNLNEEKQYTRNQESRKEEAPYLRHKDRAMCDANAEADEQYKQVSYHSLIQELLK